MIGSKLSNSDQEFLRFASAFGKNYATREEFDQRAEIFNKTLATIAQHNELQRMGLATSSMAVNAFADYTEEEWARMRGYKPT